MVTDSRHSYLTKLETKREKLLKIENGKFNREKRSSYQKILSLEVKITGNRKFLDKGKSVISFDDEF